MSDNSPRLALPFIQPAQAQKHVTHNEAIRMLDMLVQLTVVAFDAGTPPGLPQEGDVYALGPNPSGAWAGQGGTLATWLDQAWHFLSPLPGTRAVQVGTTEIRLWSGAGWDTLSVSTENLAGVGVNTTSDNTNRLAVSSAATLLSHEGAGHQVKINKAGLSDTASLLFQTNWSGRAEMGLAGDDAFSIKVSADGSTWDEVLRAGPGTQVIHTGNMVGTVNATPGIGHSVIETGAGANGSYTKFADGTLICQVADFATASGAPANWTFPASFADTSFSVTATAKGSVPAILTVSGATTASVDVESWDVSGGGTVTPNADLIAIGRWF